MSKMYMNKQMDTFFLLVIFIEIKIITVHIKIELCLPLQL